MRTDVCGILCGMCFMIAMEICDESQLTEDVRLDLLGSDLID